MKAVLERNLGFLGYPNYSVDTDGLVRNSRGDTLKPIEEKDGYVQVMLCKNGKYKHFKVHRLVGLSFIDNPNNYPQINHKDYNPKNNKVSNLEWCDNKYNTMYSKAKPILMIEPISGIVVKEFECIRDADLYFNKQIHQNICACLKGKQKTAQGYMFKYK